MRLTTRLVRVACLLGFFALGRLLGQQPAVPASEGDIMAGRPFEIDVILQTVPSQQLNVNVTYSLMQPSGVSDLSALPRNHWQFGCSGGVSPGKQVARLDCNTNIALMSGEYHTDGKINLTRPETGDQQSDDGRAPIITLVANPDAVTLFPKVASTALVLPDREALLDGSLRAQDLLNSISKELPAHPRNTPAYRTYLEQRSEMARTVVDITRRRYISGSLPPGPTSGQYKNFQVPVFFEDFDRRLSRLIRELGGNPSSPSAELNVGTPRFVLAQLPKTAESVTVTPGSGNLDKNMDELVHILTEIRDGWKKMSDSGSLTFSWSVTTTPPGAEIWYSRLNEEEKKWAGLTNVKDQTLPYAIWTFRIVWGSCFQTEIPDPYLQSSINIQTTEVGCKRK